VCVCQNKEKNNLLAVFRKMTEFNEMYMGNIPTREEYIARESSLFEIRNCLIGDNVTRVDYEEQLGRLTELLERFVTLTDTQRLSRKYVCDCEDHFGD
jgi:hypothetical protein